MKTSCESAPLVTAFTVMTFSCLGMGEDGHTASLFPGTDALKENSKWVVANFVPKFNTYRVTPHLSDHQRRAACLLSCQQQRQGRHSCRGF